MYQGLQYLACAHYILPLHTEYIQYYTLALVLQKKKHNMKPEKTNIMVYILHPLICLIASLTVWCVSCSTLVGGPQVEERVHSLFQSRAFEKLVDFDNHLDNIEMDWTNLSVNHALETSAAREE